MMDTNERIALQARAEHARQLLEDPLLQEVFEGMREDAFQAWVNTTPEQAFEREQLYDFLRAIESFKCRLQTCLEDYLLTNKGENDG